MAVKADPDKPSQKLKLAEALAAAGEYQEALEISLELVREHKQQFGEPARKIMVNIFQLLPSSLLCPSLLFLCGELLVTLAVSMLRQVVTRAACSISGTDQE